MRVETDTKKNEIIIVSETASDTYLIDRLFGYARDDNYISTRLCDARLLDDGDCVIIIDDKSQKTISHQPSIPLEKIIDELGKKTNELINNISDDEVSEKFRDLLSILIMLGCKLDIDIYTELHNTMNQ